MVTNVEIVEIFGQKYHKELCPLLESMTMFSLATRLAKYNETVLNRSLYKNRTFRIGSIFNTSTCIFVSLIKFELLLFNATFNNISVAVKLSKWNPE
jgi:hypothetical protein